MAALHRCKEDKMNVVSVLKYTSQSWKGVTIETLLQASPNILENLPDCLVVDKKKHPEGECGMHGSGALNAE